MCSGNCLHFGVEKLRGKGAAMNFSLQSSEWLHLPRKWGCRNAATKSYSKESVLEYFK